VAQRDDPLNLPLVIRLGEVTQFAFDERRPLAQLEWFVVCEFDGLRPKRVLFKIIGA
jgi:hypothetical protein